MGLLLLASAEHCEQKPAGACLFVSCLRLRSTLLFSSNTTNNVQTRHSWTVRSFKLGPIYFPETPVTNYQTMSRNRLFAHVFGPLGHLQRVASVFKNIEKTVG
jgi:hypothetical protein